MTEPNEIREWLSAIRCELADVKWSALDEIKYRALLAMLDERERGAASGEVKHIQEGFPKKGGQNQKPSSSRPMTPPSGQNPESTNVKNFNAVGDLIAGNQGGAVTKADVFVKHIENHLRGLGHKVVCKICNKTIDEIFREAVVAGEEEKDGRTDD